ncbi:MAG: tRNA dihydrouridine synthase DusB [Nanobdellota archaeon]
MFSSKAFLAPMAGITDPAFRLLCHNLGAGLTTTDLVSVNSIAAKGTELIEYSEKETPRAIQLFGNDPGLTEEAVKKVSKNFDIIDFNIGCPAKKITQAEAGAALLEKPERLREIFKALTSTKTTATIKMRTGVKEHGRHIEIARIAEEEGISMITLHARTLKQGYSGKADWEQIKRLKEAVNIPVIGNGDIRSPEDAKRMMEETGCDYVMIGRAAMGNPYIFRQVDDYLRKGDYEGLSEKKKLSYFMEYLRLAEDFPIKFADIKEHAMKYTKGTEGGAGLRDEITRAESIDDIKRILTTP